MMDNKLIIDKKEYFWRRIDNCKVYEKIICTDMYDFANTTLIPYLVEELSFPKNYYKANSSLITFLVDVMHKEGSVKIGRNVEFGIEYLTKEEFQNLPEF